jgi:hypothetical protein
VQLVGKTEAIAESLNGPHSRLTFDQARIRGSHRRTFLQYSSYSAPNIFRSVGSS